MEGGGVFYDSSQDQRQRPIYSSYRPGRPADFCHPHFFFLFIIHLRNLAHVGLCNHNIWKYKLAQILESDKMWFSKHAKKLVIRQNLECQGSLDKTAENTHLRALSSLWCWPFGHPIYSLFAGGGWSKIKISFLWLLGKSFFCIPPPPPPPPRTIIMFPSFSYHEYGR